MPIVISLTGKCDGCPVAKADLAELIMADRYVDTQLRCVHEELCNYIETHLKRCKTYAKMEDDTT